MHACRHTLPAHEPTRPALPAAAAHAACHPGATLPAPKHPACLRACHASAAMQADCGTVQVRGRQLKAEDRQVHKRLRIITGTLAGAHPTLCAAASVTSRTYASESRQHAPARTQAHTRQTHARSPSPHMPTASPTTPWAWVLLLRGGGAVPLPAGKALTSGQGLQTRP